MINKSVSGQNPAVLKKEKPDMPAVQSIAALPAQTKLAEPKKKDQKLGKDKKTKKADLKKTAAKDMKPGAAAETSATPATQADVATSKTGQFYHSIRFKLIFIISIIIMTSLTGMIFLASYFFKNDNKIRVQENNLQLAEVIALKIKSEVEKYELVSSAMLGQGKNEPIAGYENLLEIGDKDVIFTGIVEKTGKENKQKFIKIYYNRLLMNKHVIADKDLAALNETNEKVYELSFSGENIIINISPYFNLPSYALSFPYERDANGSVRSVKVVFIKLESLLKTFKTAGIINVFMINYNGDVIAHPDINLTLTGANLASIPICSMMMKSKIDNGQTRYRDEKGTYYLGSFKKIDSSGFGIIATAKENEAFEAVYQIQNRNMIITAMVLTATILFIFFFGKTITSPIIHLVGATKKIINGQFHVDIVPTTRDEIGQLTSTFIEMGKGLEEREKIKSAFGKFVNKELAEAALKDEIRLGGERKTVAILFSDIRSFTEISEKLEPEEVVEFLNSYMTKMVTCIEKMNGIVDKFIGDAIMAVWGTPISRSNDTENAINSALLMRNELITYNKELSGPKMPFISMGCGINTGIVLAGQIGTENHMEYTIIGDPVNLASRIEALNKFFGTDILISEDSYTLVKDIFAVEKMQQIKVKGKAYPQQIYAVLGRLDDAESPKSLAALQALLGIEARPLPSDDTLHKLFDRGEEKYEIIEK
jgi:adenylate cyclase